MQPTIILISAGTEWRVVLRLLQPSCVESSSLGDFFYHSHNHQSDPESLIFFHGGWGKVPAAASTQFVIDRWKPALIINIGSCGGFRGFSTLHEIILASRTVIYDIVERMADPDEAIERFSTTIDLDWLPREFLSEVRRGTIVSADRDLGCEDVGSLITKYNALCGDWESGAIALVAARNKVPVLILRGVTDLVDSRTGDAHDNIEFFRENVRIVMQPLIALVFRWLPQISTHLPLP